MAKKPEMQVHVQSSAFKELLVTQKDALNTMKSMEEVMKQIRLMEFGSLVEEIKLLKEGEGELKVVQETKKVQDKQLKELQKISSKSPAGEGKDKDEEAKAIANLAKSVYTLKTMGDKFADFGKNLKDKFSISSLKTGLLSKLNVGGIFSKSIDREKFIKQQRAAGSTDDRDQLKEKFEGAYKTSRQLQKVGGEFEKNRKEAGLSESEYGKTVKGKELLAKKSQLAEEHGKYDIRAAMVAKADKEESANVSPTQQHADSGAAEEQSIEAQKNIDSQTTLLTKIEENTRGDSPAQKAKPAEGGKEGGGIMSGLLGGAGKALDGMKKFGIGLLAVSAALWVAAEAFKNFGDVDWDMIGKGMVALGGLVLAAIGLDKVKGSIIKGAMVLGVLGLAVWGIGEAFKTFADLDWETIGKGMAAIVGLGVIAAVMGTFIVPMALGAAALLGLGAALWVVGEAMQAVGQGFKDMTDGIERLAALDGGNLLTVAAGIGALGLAMAAFGAGQAAAGLGNLVSRFLTIGTDSPVEQLLKIGATGAGVEKAGIGMEKLSAGMVAFNKVDAKSLESLKKFPWEQATKFAAAGGQMSANGATVSNASKQNADAAATTGGKGGGNTTVVNAPVNNSAKTTNVMKPNIRNQESSQARLTSSKFVF